MSNVTLVSHDDTVGAGIEAPSTRRSVIRSLADPASRVPTYVGVVLVLVGFALIGVAWAKVAPLTNVALQIPYVLSAGLPGLGLVMVGLVVVNVSARRQDSAERARQLETLTEAMRALQRDARR